jgi:hypothetical protein
MGALVKVGVNVVNGWMHNSAEERRNNALRDGEIVKAQIELAKTVSRDNVTKCIRGAIFLMIVTTWCYMAIYGLHNPNMEYDIILPKGNNWSIQSLFSSSDWSVRKISGSVLMWQWFSLVEMILGFFVVPSRRR